MHDHSPGRPQPQFVLIGASVRAAAQSARRAGYYPLGCDQFADADLRAATETLPPAAEIRDLVSHIEQLDSVPPLPVLYTGALENHPDLVERLSGSRPVLGCSAAALRLARDPFEIREAIRKVHLPFLEVRTADDPPPPDGQWLLKPLHSGGGRGITLWDETASHSPTLSRPHYFQQRVEGIPCSAVFLAGEGIGDVRFIGITEQLIGEPLLHAPAFGWCGNIGPIGLAIGAEQHVRRMANYFKWKFQLRGLFGVDFIAGPDDRVWLTEINPRYPASLELLEFALGEPLLAEHLRCFPEAPAPAEAPAAMTAETAILGKAVLYAPHRLQVTLPQPLGEPDFHRWPTLADIPPPDSIIEAGAPVCTLFTSGNSQSDCRERLLAAAQQLDATLRQADA